MMRSPLARLGAIKTKLGALLGGAIVLTIVVLLGGAELGLPTWVTALIALGAGLVAVDLLGSGLTAPLRQMARQADRLADGGPVDPVTDTARDEVGELALAFNRMAREVAHTDRVRRELVANVSHELRTPLAALSATLENLVDGVEEAGPQQLRRIEAQVGRLRHLVDDLLDLSQLDAGAATLDHREVDLVRLVADVAYAAGPVAADRVVVEVEDGATTVVADPARLRQVVVNLVDNALRHGPGDEPVTVRAQRVGERLHLTVADTGPGIAVADAHRVFDRFTRTDLGRDVAAGGAGLGLAITRWIVELHGGSIRVDRPGEPGGRLTVELPMTPTADPAGQLPPPDPTTGATVATRTRERVVPVDTGSLGVLPTPIAGLRRRGVVAALVAGVAAATLPPFEGNVGLGLALVLVTGGVATMVALDRELDRFGRACAGIAIAAGAMWAVSDAAWVLVPLTVGSVLLAGLGVWGPRRFGDGARALVVGPLVAAAAPLALVRGVRSQRGVAIGRVLVPAAVTLLVLLVFGGLLADADAVFARALDAITPDLRLDASLVGRTVLGVVAAVGVAAYVLVQRAGTVPTEPWARPVRPVTDWAVPLVALDLLVGAFVVVQLGVLFGGDDRVQTVAGLTYAEYARTGFGQLLVVALLTLGVIGLAARVAGDEHRHLRDRLLGVLVVLTGVVLLSSVQRLALYVDVFGLSRLRISAFAALLWVAVVLGLVVTAGLVVRFAPHLPRTVIMVTGALALSFAVVRPDAVIARVNLDRAAAGAELDPTYLAGLSADAVPTLVRGRSAAEAADLVGGVFAPGDLPPDVFPVPEPDGAAPDGAGSAALDVPAVPLIACGSSLRDSELGNLNLARWQARRALDALDLTYC